MLIDAVCENADLLRDNNCIFNIYGPDCSGSTEELLEMIKQKQINDIVNLFSGIHGKEKEQVLLNTDVFVLTSRFEGHPMGLIEALSYGVPALVTSGSNMLEEIKQNQAGWTAMCNSVSIGNSLIEIVNSKEKIEKYSINAKNLAMNYQWDVISEKTHLILIEYLKNN